jgi:hypothetical protein
MELPVPASEPMITDDNHEESLKYAEKSRARRRRRVLKGKSREEKEEMAREKVDLEVLREQFLNVDPSEVCFIIRYY